MAKAVRTKKKTTVNWYVTRKPNATLYEEYDFASNAEQAKQQISDLVHMGAIAEKSTRQGGRYVIWVRKRK
jgi:hypothetical protein